MMNIAMGFDSNFAPYAAVTIKSVMLYNKNVRFYIMYDKGLKKSDIKKITSLIKTGENCTVEWVNIEGKFNHLNAGGWKSKSVYFPVALPSLCPYDRILFLDADILVTGSLEGLYNQNMDGYYIASTTDIGMYANFCNNNILKSNSFNGKIQAKEYFKNIFNYTKTEDILNYINSGTVLLNLQLMRENNIGNKMLEAVNNIDFAYKDQCCFNYVCKGKIKLFPKDTVLFIIKPYLIDKLPQNIKEKYIQTYNSKNSPLIIHFLQKPWLEPEINMPYKKQFNEIRKQTPYKYHKHTKEIFKFRFSKNGKYLHLLGKKIFDSRKDLNKYAEMATT